ncbi:hypothetical protein RVBP21_1380 [Pseudomonas phage BRkr]|nr:hypothetical protein RVBP21_1380 [Pseudomonas phage BRkr]
MVPLQAEATEVRVDEVYCEALALAAHATAEARGRSEPIAKWKQNLLALKGYGVKDKDNVLYKILPKAIQDVRGIYDAKDSPRDAYMASFDSCMSEDYGKMVVIR